MQLVMIMVQTTDGVIARNSAHSPFEWSSPEDKQNFRELVGELDGVIIGGNTYKMAEKEDLAKRLSFVVTNHPENYEEHRNVIYVKGMAKEIYEEVEDRGLRKVGLLGGSHINSLFLEARLVNEIYLTVEPKLFGDGLHVSASEELNVDLQLLSVRQLNNKGTVLLHYQVLRH